MELQWFFNNLLGILLLGAAIYLLIKSPKKLQTLGRMLVAFVVTLLLCIVPGAILRMGDPWPREELAVSWGCLSRLLQAGGTCALLNVPIRKRRGSRAHSLVSNSAVGEP